MAYDERDDLRDGLEDISEETDTYYEDPAYMDEYETFYERRDTADERDDELAEDDSTTADRLETGFGEAINADENPHISDQLEDDQLAEEAEADYAGAEKDKFDERTDGRNL